MVQADGGDDAYYRSDDVGAVEPPAQAGFEHCGVHSPVSKKPERHPGGDFKKAQPGEAVVPVEEVKRFLTADHFESAGGDYFDPLAEIDKVRRSVKSHFETAPGEPGGNHGAHGALAVCPGHVNDRIFTVWMSYGLIQELHPLEAGVVRPGLETLGGDAAVSCEQAFEPLPPEGVSHREGHSLKILYKEVGNLHIEVGTPLAEDVMLAAGVGIIICSDVVLYA